MPPPEPEIRALLTDGQFAGLMAVLSTGIAGLLATLRWGIKRVVSAMNRGSLALGDNAVAFTRFEAKLDTLLEVLGVKPRLAADSQNRKPADSSRPHRVPKEDDRGDYGDPH